MKRKIIWSRFLILIAVVLSIFLGIYCILRKPIKKIVSKDIEGFIASNDISVKIYDDEFKENKDIIRGKKIKINDNEIKDESGKIYYKIKDKDIKGYILKDNFTKDEKETVLEKEMYVRTYLTVYKNLDNAEILSTINKFFENSLNVSETSRQLYIHRNTLVYRLDKLQKCTGLDLRVFEDAITFKIALMVVKYMKYMESMDY